MLVLTRRTGEQIMFDLPKPYGPITVALLTARNGRAMIGITAPLCVNIRRQEIHEPIKAKDRRKGAHRKEIRYGQSLARCSGCK